MELGAVLPFAAQLRTEYNGTDVYALPKKPEFLLDDGRRTRFMNRVEVFVDSVIRYFAAFLQKGSQIAVPMAEERPARVVVAPSAQYQKQQQFSG